MDNLYKNENLNFYDSSVNSDVYKTGDTETTDNIRQESLSAGTYKGVTSKSPVLTLQLFLCVVILIGMFVLKFTFADIFTEAYKWYNTELYSTLFFSGDVKELDYSSFFSSTTDEV